MTMARSPARAALAGPRRLTGRRGLPVAGAAASFAAVSLGVLSHWPLDALDVRVARWSVTHQLPGLRIALRAFAWLGDPGIALGVLLAGAGLAAVASRSPRPVMSAALTILLAGGAGVLLKDFYGRVGPAFSGYPYLHARGNSYPSGHELLALVCWGYVARVGAGLRPGWRRPAAGLAGLVALVVGAAMVFGPAHWLTDVLGAAALGALVLLVVPCPVAAVRESVGS